MNTKSLDDYSSNLTNSNTVKFFSIKIYIWRYICSLHFAVDIDITLDRKFVCSWRPDDAQNPLWLNVVTGVVVPTASLYASVNTIVDWTAVS